MLSIRIQGHGNYEVDESFTDLLNELAADAAAAAEVDDARALRERLEDLTCLVVAAGEPVERPPVPAATVVVPAMASSPDDARRLLRGGQLVGRLPAAA